MKIRSAFNTFTLLVSLCAAATPLLAATHAPKAPPQPVLPKVALHTEYLVEVNHKGQVVRVESGKAAAGCQKGKKTTNPEACTFNAQTYGNVLQMWIRHPDGTAEVGLFRVTFDYNPHTKKVRRSISLVRAGGNWANKPGAATEMIDKANAETRAYEEQQKRDAKKLPSLKQIVAPKKSPHP